MTEPRKGRSSDLVAVILAASIGLALNVVVIAILWAAAQRLGVDVNSGISENGTQLLTGWGGGIIGVLGSYIGFTFGKKASDPFLPDDVPPPKKPPPPTV
jgi:ABC-type nickel/cobalt efflux system permease component RcnA